MKIGIMSGGNDGLHILKLYEPRINVNIKNLFQNLLVSAIFAIVFMIIMTTDLMRKVVARVWKLA